MTPKDLVRFFSKVNVPTIGEELDYVNCWNWATRLNKDGYGLFTIKAKNKMSHRIIYEHYKGEIPDGYVVHHKCYNKRCVNMFHLDMITHAENSSDAARRRKSKYCTLGHEISGDNIHLRKSGQKSCLICVRRRWKTSSEVRQFINNFNNLEVQEFLESKRNTNGTD